MLIYCCECNRKVDARLTDGREIYPTRKDLSSHKFYTCDYCKNYVGCHHKEQHWHKVRPLGTIPTVELRELRQQIHVVLDPIWKKGFCTRKLAYERVARKLGYVFHVGEINTVEDAHRIHQIIIDISESLKKNRTQRLLTLESQPHEELRNDCDFFGDVLSRHGLEDQSDLS